MDDYPPNEMKKRGSKRLPIEIYGESVPSNLENLFDCQTSDISEDLEATKAGKEISSDMIV